MKIILFLLLTLQCYAEPYLVVNLHGYGCGMFSVLSYVVGVLSEYEQGAYSGLEVNFEQFGLYYDPNKGPNWWSYYFEPLHLGSNASTSYKRFNIDEYNHYAFFSEFQLSRMQNYDLLHKYFHILPEIQKKIDDYIDSYFLDHHIIAIHYRGTDKGWEAEPVHHAQVIETAQNYISQNQLTNYKIFIATDEQEMVAELLNVFGSDHVIGYSTQRSQNGAPLHFGNSNPSGHGEEALIDAVLLSKGHILIRTSSNLSRWSTYLNPNLPVIELNHRR